MINILYIINNFEDISINRNIFKIASNLPKNTFRIYIVALNINGSLRSLFANRFSENLYISNGEFLNGLILTKNVVIDHDITIAQAQTSRADLLIILIKILLMTTRRKIFYIANRRNYFFLPCEPGFLYKNIVYFISCHLADLNICVANHLNHKLVNILKVPRQKVVTIFNGIKPRNKTFRISNRSFDNPPLIVYAGQLIKRKNIIYLLEALFETTLSYKCLIIGDGPEKQRLTLYVNKRNLENKISFIPFTTNVNKYLSKADIFVLPSLSEGMSMSLLEAMSFGNACVVSDIDANKELISNAKNGLLFPLNGGITALAKRISVLLKSPQLRSRLGRAALKTVTDTFRQSISLNKYSEKYYALTINSRNERNQLCE